MEIIRSIFAFYNLDMAVHNSYPVENPEEQQVDGDEEVAGFRTSSVSQLHSDARSPHSMHQSNMPFHCD